ncbi:MAG: acyl-CoA synthetase [Kiloniellales bacterium]
MQESNPFEDGLPRNAANYAALSPLGFLERAAAVHPQRTAVVEGPLRRDWATTAARCRQFASALTQRGIGLGDTVAVLAPNSATMLEAHFGVPMAGAVLNAINYRLDAATIAFILEHGEAKAFVVDSELAPLAAEALAKLKAKPLLVEAAPAGAAFENRLGGLDYEALLADGDPAFAWAPPADEWQAIALNYTSGTTGNPKGVVYHHRGAYLNALGNIQVWEMDWHPTYLWTLPMFHCNGWCFPWAVTALAGTHVCLRKVEAEAIYRAFAEEGVTHLCGAPIVMQAILGAPPAARRPFAQKVRMMTAAAPPPAAVLAAMAEAGIEVTHVYGLTEVYGPAVVCAWKPEWDALPIAEQAQIKARQGMAYPALEGLEVVDPETLEPVPRDGATLGEVTMRGNIVMKGYLKNPAASAEAFAGGWFHSGDLAVVHPDGYIELKDRAKDIIISGGENISSIEVEDALYRHPAVAVVAVVARPDEKWGESPCAFVELKPGASASDAELIAFCRERLAHFKAPRTIVFRPIPKTSTGKIQKFLLREQAKAL